MKHVGKGKRGDRYRVDVRVGEFPKTAYVKTGPDPKDDLGEADLTRERQSLVAISHHLPIPGYHTVTRRVTDEFEARALEANAKRRQGLADAINGFEALLRRTEAGLSESVEDSTILDALFRSAVISFRETYGDNPPARLVAEKGGPQFFDEMTAIRNGYAAHPFGALRQAMAHVTCLALKDNVWKPEIVGVAISETGTPRPAIIRAYLRLVKICLQSETDLQQKMGDQALASLLRADQAVLHALPEAVTSPVKTADAGRSQNQIDKGISPRRAR